MSRFDRLASEIEPRRLTRAELLLCLLCGLGAVLVLSVPGWVDMQAQVVAQVCR